MRQISIFAEGTEFQTERIRRPQLQNNEAALGATTQCLIESDEKANNYGNTKMGTV